MPDESELDLPKLRAAAGGSTNTVVSVPPCPPDLIVDRIGPYHLLELLGSGGMGEVYKAERRSPMRQVVALKVIKLGFDTRDVIARFENERQALARMDHPHVAQVHDAGTTETGRPYFAMEYVPGETITKFADHNRLTIADRLLLFCQVCDAIAHAHTKAIIHRDIKASNVLAFTQDGKPTIKVIDFGVAKALTGDRLTDRTFNTERGQVIGSYQSMSPEQAAGSPDIDTRSDVYSLGALLYELLTGAPPFDHAELAAVADSEIRRMIREVEPPRPSVRLHTLQEDSAVIAAARQTVTDQLYRQLHSELEWIPLKAMRKERERRYKSPLELARDIENYLAHRPLLAGPDSRTYRLRKSLYKRRVPLSVAAGFLFTIAALTGWYIHDIRQKQIKVEKALVQSVRARDMLMGVFRAQDPRQGGRQDKLVSQAMEDAVRELEQGYLSDQPALRASLLADIATILNNNGKSDRALSLAERALKIRKEHFGPTDPAVAQSLLGVGEILNDLGRYAEAEKFCEDARDLFKRVYEGDRPEIARCVSFIGSVRQTMGRLPDAESLFEQALAMRRRLTPGDDKDVAESLSDLGLVRVNLGRAAEAEPLVQQALDMRRRLIGGDSPLIAESLNNLGGARQRQGKYADAADLYKQALDMSRRLHPDAHAEVANCMSSLAGAYHDLGRDKEAEVLCRDALDMRRRLYRDDNLAIASSLDGLATIQEGLGQVSEAEARSEEALAMRRRIYGTDHQAIAKSLGGLAMIRLKLGKLREAEELQQESLEMYRRVYATEHSSMAVASHQLGLIRKELGKVKEAEACFRDALRIREKALGREHPQTQQTATQLAALLLATDRAAEAASLRRDFKLDTPTTAPLSGSASRIPAVPGK